MCEHAKVRLRLLVRVIVGNDVFNLGHRGLRANVIGPTDMDEEVEQAHTHDRRAAHSAGPFHASRLAQHTGPRLSPPYNIWLRGFLRCRGPCAGRRTAADPSAVSAV